MIKAIISLIIFSASSLSAFAQANPSAKSAAGSTELEYTKGMEVKLAASTAKLSTVRITNVEILDSSTIPGGQTRLPNLGDELVAMGFTSTSLELSALELLAKGVSIENQAGASLITPTHESLNGQSEQSPYVKCLAIFEENRQAGPSTCIVLTSFKADKSNKFLRLPGAPVRVKLPTALVGIIPPEALQPTEALPVAELGLTDAEAPYHYLAKLAITCTHTGSISNRCPLGSPPIIRELRCARIRPDPNEQVFADIPLMSKHYRDGLTTMDYGKLRCAGDGKWLSTLKYGQRLQRALPQ